MNNRHTLIAFLATLLSIVIMVIVATFAAANGRSIEALGIGGAVTGLIGVLGTFKPRTVNLDDPIANPITEQTP